MRTSLLLTAFLVITSMNGLARASDRPLPAAVDLRPEFQKFGLTPKQQGQRDTCSLFAITGLIEFEVARSAAANRPARLSEEYLIWAANEAAGGSTDQAMFYEAVCGLQTFGICAEPLMPYRAGQQGARRPSAAAGRDAKSRNMWEPHWIKRWDVKSGLSAEQIVELKRQLAGGHPVAAGLRWPQANRSRPDQILEVPPPTQVFDGHSILFVGYRDDPRLPGGGVFTFRNSSGPNWGEKGYGTMSYAYARAYANDALALHLLSGRSPDRAKATLWFEAEELRHAGTCSNNVQDMAGFGRMWSGGKHLFGGCEQGGSVEMAVPVRKAGRYAVSAFMTCAPDFGRCSFAIDDTPIGSEFDGYSGRVHASGRIRLGEIELTEGIHRLRVTSTGKNRLSEGFRLGIDGIEFVSTE